MYGRGAGGARGHGEAWRRGASCGSGCCEGGFCPPSSRLTDWLPGCPRRPNSWPVRPHGRRAGHPPPAAAPPGGGNECNEQLMILSITGTPCLAAVCAYAAFLAFVLNTRLVTSRRRGAAQRDSTPPRGDLVPRLVNKYLICPLCHDFPSSIYCYLHHIHTNSRQNTANTASIDKCGG